MKDSDFYPAGASNDPRAPYNEPYIEERPFGIECTVTLQSCVHVKTSNYNEYVDEEDGHLRYDTSGVNWKDEYERQHYTIQNLLAVLSDYICDDLGKTKDKREIHRLKDMLSDCEGWCLIEETYEY